MDVYLDCGNAFWFYMYMKIYQIVRIKYVQFFAYCFYFKAIKKHTYWK